MDPWRIMLPKGSTYIGGGQITLETLPGLWVSYKSKESRLRSSVEIETTQYAIYYRNKMILIQGAVATTINGEPTNSGGLKRYNTLFELVANSLVVSNIYK